MNIKQIETQFKPKVLYVAKLVQDKVILTDSYSWEDFRKAIRLAYEEGKKSNDDEGKILNEKEM